MENSEIKKLNQEYGIRNHLVFKAGPGGLVVADIKNARGEATVALHGGQVLSFRPEDHEPVLWLSKYSQFKTGQAVRGGIPVCWPWFGDHPSDPAKPAHGFVRTALWSVSESAVLADGGTRLILSMSDGEETMKLWPHRFRLAIDISVSDILQTKLITTNTDNAAFTYGGALHSYFSISSPANVLIKGLDGGQYLDKVASFRRQVQEGDVLIEKETDRIYLDTTAACIIEDRGRQRRIGIAKTGSRTTVVWNPWIEKAQKMKDFGDDEYLGMVCVETANADTDVVSLAPGATHTLESIIRLAPLAD